MKKITLYTLLFLSSILFFTTQIQAGELHISCAASTTDALKEIIGAYKQTHQGTTILPNFASSGSLAKQIEQGAPVDIYVSANEKWMHYLVTKQVISSEKVRELARNELVFVGSSTTTINTLEELPSLNRIAIGSPKSVPAGDYAAKALQKAGLWDSLENNKKLIMAKDVRQALLYADRGEADGAFVYRTDAMLAKNAAILFAVETTKQIQYPTAITKLGEKKSEAKEFFDFLTGTTAADILKKYGFIPSAGK